MNLVFGLRLRHELVTLFNDSRASVKERKNSVGSQRLSTDSSEGHEGRNPRIFGDGDIQINDFTE